MSVAFLLFLIALILVVVDLFPVPGPLLHIAGILTLVGLLVGSHFG